MISKDYHTHTFRCGHASGDIDDLCKVAVSKGLTVLGISDHTPLPGGVLSSIRMDMEELVPYCSAIDSARLTHPGLTVLKGMECDFSRDFVDFYSEVLLEQNRLDYLIGGVHFFKLHGEWASVYGGTHNVATLRAYTDLYIEAMESGLFTFMAHPDLFANAYMAWDSHALSCSRAILEAAEDLNMPLEINGYGLRKDPVQTVDGPRCPYPWPKFWELARFYDIPVIVNSDAHQPEDVGEGLELGMELAHSMELRIADLTFLESKTRFDVA